jgi:hypothetical protein
MPKIIKTLFKSKRKEPTPEEIEALDRATFVLRCRVERMIAKDRQRHLSKAA